MEQHTLFKADSILSTYQKFPQGLVRILLLVFIKIAWETDRRYMEGGSAPQIPFLSRLIISLGLK